MILKNFQIKVIWVNTLIHARFFVSIKKEPFIALLMVPDQIIADSLSVIVPEKVRDDRFTETITIYHYVLYQTYVY